MQRPNLFTIPPEQPFAEALAQGTFARLGREPLALCDVLILLPTRRAVETVREAFARAGTGLLPKIAPLSGLEPDTQSEPLSTQDRPLPSAALTPLARDWQLMRLIRQWAATQGSASIRRFASAPADAFALAQDLAHLMDEASMEGVDWPDLATLVPDELAEHWQVSASCLSIISKAWPEYLAAKDLQDSVRAELASLAAMSRQWQHEPPPHPVIVAGSTGSIPATAALMRTVANLPNGFVVLPGLDLALDEESYTALEADHPQFGMRELLNRLDITRRDVGAWTPAPVEAPRTALLREAMRPPATIGQWPGFVAGNRAALTSAIEGLTIVSAANETEEALAVALILREALETPGKTAALVTPDRGLARRVQAELGRWGITIDDSAGTPLSKTRIGAFLALLLDCVAEDAAPVPLLSLLKHPLACFGFQRHEARAAALELELMALRGPRPQSSFQGLQALLQSDPPLADEPDDRRGTKTHATRALGFVSNVEAALASLITLAPSPAPPSLWAEALRQAATAAMHSPDGLDPWETLEAQAAATLLDGLAAQDSQDTALSLRDFIAIHERLMESTPLRARFGRHPRLRILGPLEARLLMADRVVLGSLTEGVWPRLGPEDAWLNRPMRKQLKLGLPERRIGLSAHDFVAGASARDVFLTYSEKAGGKPVNPSRWIVRLETLLESARLNPAVAGQRWLDWARALDVPDAVKPMAPPRPAPPLAARPRRLWVTHVRTLIRDPYAFYARRILRLKTLEDLDAEPDAREMGTAIHRALELFTKRYPGRLPPDPQAELLAAGREALTEAGARPAVAALWIPRFERIARWMAAFEASRRNRGQQVFAECAGSMTLALPAGPVALEARADRIEQGADGSLHILDFKTGQAPSNTEVEAGFDPQLPLQAAIAAAGGFPEVVPSLPESLLYVQLTGRDPPGTDRPLPDPATLTRSAIEGLIKLIAFYDDERRPYLSRPRVQFQDRFDDYAHLARAKEWRTDEDGSS